MISGSDSMHLRILYNIHIVEMKHFFFADMSQCADSQRSCGDGRRLV